MILFIPLGGIGERFKRYGYTEPKALIKVEEIPIIFWLFDNLNIQHINIEYVYITYNKEYEEHDFENIIKDRYVNVKFKFLKLNINTEGALETLKIALDEIENDKCI